MKDNLNKETLSHCTLTSTKFTKKWSQNGNNNNCFARSGSLNYDNLYCLEHCSDWFNLKWDFCGL